MFARVQTIHQPAEALDALAVLAQEQLDAMPGLSGFHGFRYLIDRDNGKALVISFWENEDDVRRLEADNAAVRERVKQEARIESPPSEIYEVAVSG